MSIFVFFFKRWSLILGCFFPVSILKVWLLLINKTSWFYHDMPVKYLRRFSDCFTPFLSLSENFPDTEFFLVRMRENTDQKKLRIWTLSTQ